MIRKITLSYYLVSLQTLNETKKFTPEKIIFTINNAGMTMPAYFNNKAVSTGEDLLHVLIKMRETADSYLDGTVNNADVTVPVYFNNKAVSAGGDLLHALIKIGETADSYLDGTVNNTGMTMPVYFNNKAVSTGGDLLHGLDQDRGDG
ncbi:hypothetical protein CPC735_001570 [Coccidioides posadasii C735 delta SOWgp]|uniref:Uncharacterized protein n=1 Tax=Coccidioides posadasii (strain C735) TaxID=222929 RepID=C5PE79_COCP7|nr:hypothetical protein CPC735_001570 [Coccidioides posadasii C735 delta SOWgp]EER24812.1 hypothetical protein CPC735_001570 [Coccidioides posadasii C735 delta SOWgp]|eukprot:XP_003066957.1 hypothetical protein CPC735_001570 [Coccidioides posadasii C735 delta SOWgp]